MWKWNIESQGFKASSLQALICKRENGKKIRKENNALTIKTSVCL
jgi:hypothetical protein